MAGKIASLTDEALAKVFSFFNKPELLRASQVCSKWNEIAKNPSLWKELDVEFDSGNLNLFTNCFTFLAEVPYVQYLRLGLKGNVYLDNNSMERIAFNSFMKNANNLKCLSVNYNLKIQSPFLPVTITHLNFGSLEKEEIISFIEQSTKLEYLNLSSYPKFVTKEIIKPLLRHVDSLKYLYIPCQDAECLSSIGNFQNLEELGLLTCHDLNSQTIAQLSKFKNLERLYIQNAMDFNTHFISSLTQDAFPSLKHFAIDSCDFVTSDFFNMVCKHMLKLESFAIGETYSTVEEIANFMKSCKTLKFISINIICKDSVMVAHLLKEIFKINQEKPFESICFCSLKSIRESIVADNIKSNQEIQQLFNSFTCLCGKFCPEDINTYVCHCFSGTGIACYHKQVE